MNFLRLLFLLPVIGLFGTFAISAQNTLNLGVEKEQPEERWVGVSDTLTMDELLDVAVKFFAITHIDDNDRLVGQLCTASKAHAVTQPERNKKIEAFCTGVIFTHVEDGEYDIYQEYLDALHEVNILNLGLNRQERLLRAQGALFMLMKMNPKLRALFRMEYEKQKHMLHFVLTSD